VFTTGLIHIIMDTTAEVGVVITAEEDIMGAMPAETGEVAIMVDTIIDYTY
jgi:hypothetical protein